MRDLGSEYQEEVQCWEVKGVKSRLLTDLIRLLGTSPSGIGYSLAKAQLIVKDQKYQLINLLCVGFIVFIAIP